MCGRIRNWVVEATGEISGWESFEVGFGQLSRDD